MTATTVERVPRRMPWASVTVTLCTRPKFIDPNTRQCHKDIHKPPNESGALPVTWYRRSRGGCGVELRCDRLSYSWSSSLLLLQWCWCWWLLLSLSSLMPSVLFFPVAEAFTPWSSTNPSTPKSRLLTDAALQVSTLATLNPSALAFPFRASITPPAAVTVATNATTSTPPLSGSTTTTDSVWETSPAVAATSSLLQSKKTLSLVGPSSSSSGILTPWIMAAGGITFSAIVVYALAMNPDLVLWGDNPTEALEVAAENVVEAAVPESTGDLASIALAEAMGGVTGAVASSSVARMMTIAMAARGTGKNQFSSMSTASAAAASLSSSLSLTTLTIPRAMLAALSTVIAAATSASTTLTTTTTTAPWETGVTSRATLSTTTSSKTRVSKDTNLLANIDFFVAQAGVSAFLSLLGFSTPVTVVLSAVLAVIPYELVVFGSRRRTKRLQEAALMEQLLQEQQRKEAIRRRNRFGQWMLPTSYSSSYSTSTGMTTLEGRGTNVKSIDLDSLRPVVPEEKENAAVEIFSDLVKWLAFAVLDNELAGQLCFGDVHLSSFPGAEGFIFGVLSAVSSQFYADVLYGVFGWGGDTKQREVRSRTLQDWSGILLTRSLAGGTLFGVYETAQIPIQATLTALLSGGVDNCIGSNEFNTCVEVFLIDNPPMLDTPAEEGKALVNALSGLWDRVVSP